MSTDQNNLDPVLTGLPITGASGGLYSFSFKNTLTVAHDIYVGINGPIAHYDGVQSVVEIIAGSDVQHATAVAGYIRNANPSATTKTNAVVLFGLGVAAVDGAPVWGVNTLLSDSDGQIAGAGVGRTLIGAEHDFQVMNTGTELMGVSVGGNGKAQPKAANAFMVNSLEGLSMAGAVKWDTGFWAMDGCANIGLVIGTKHKTGADLPSQDIWVNYRKSDGNAATIAMAAQAGGFFVVNKDSCPYFTSFYIKGGNVQIDAGKSVVVDGKAVVGQRKSGWVASTGTLFRGAFDADFVFTPSLTYQQTEINSIMQTVQGTRRRLAALEADMRSHGLIGA